MMIFLFCVCAFDTTMKHKRENSGCVVLQLCMNRVGEGNGLIFINH
jgi:hypothetical protein